MPLVSMYVAKVTGPRNRELAVKLGKLKSPSTLERLARYIAGEMETRAPIESGLIKTTIRSTVTPVQKKGAGTMWVGVGPYSEMGNPKSQAPRGVIKEFLEDYPQFRARGRRGKTGWSPVDAWWILPEVGRQELDRQRDAGQYGGSVNGKVIPAYWFLQETGKYPTPYKATGKKFVEEALADIAKAAKEIYSFMET